MVQIWQMEEYPVGDPRLPHHVFPPKMVTPDDLTKRSGAITWKTNLNDAVAVSQRLAKLKMERNYGREDLFILDAKTTSNFQEKLEELFEEQEDPMEQARMVVDGSAYYDIEDKNGLWVRIHLEAGDWIVIPAKKLYRFTTTPQNYVKMKRFYKN